MGEDFKRHQPLDVIVCGLPLPAHDTPDVVEGFQQDRQCSFIRLTKQDPMAADSFAEHLQIPTRATEYT